MQAMAGIISSELAAGLHYLAADSILFGYSTDNCKVGSSPSPLFTAGRVSGENVKAYAMADGISNESQFLDKIAKQLEEEIKGIP